MPQLRLRHAASFLLILSTVAYKCGQEDPDLMTDPGVTTASITVSAVDEQDNPVVGARIYLDGMLEGVTPLTVDVDPGQVTVEIDTTGFVASPRDTTLDLTAGDEVAAEFRLSHGFPRTVFCEDFTNWDCAGCPETEELLLDITDGDPYDEVVTVSLHTFIPGLDDPFFLANPIEMRERFITFYGVQANPRVAIDGLLLDGVPPNESDMRAKLAADRAAVSPVDLEITQAVVGSQASVDVTIRSVANVSGDWRLLVMMIQTEFTHVPGSNGQTHFTRVIRDFVPTVNGEAVTVTEGMDQSFHYDVDLLTAANPPDDPATAASVVVLQNWDTLEILQTASTLE